MRRTRHQRSTSTTNSASASSGGSVNDGGATGENPSRAPPSARNTIGAPRRHPPAASMTAATNRTRSCSSSLMWTSCQDHAAACLHFWDSARPLAVLEESRPHTIRHGPCDSGRNARRPRGADQHLQPLHRPYAHHVRPAAVYRGGAAAVALRRPDHGDAGPHRLLVAADNQETVLGYASSSGWRPKPAYRTTVEASVYCHPDACGQGVGTALYAALFTSSSARISRQSWPASRCRWPVAQAAREGTGSGRSASSTRLARSSTSSGTSPGSNIPAAERPGPRLKSQVSRIAARCGSTI